MPDWNDIKEILKDISNPNKRKRIPAIVFFCVLTTGLVFFIVKTQKELTADYITAIVFSIILIIGLFVFFLCEKTIKLIGGGLFLIGIILLFIFPLISFNTEIEPSPTALYTLPPTLTIEHTPLPVLTSTTTNAPTKASTLIATISPSNVLDFKENCLPNGWKIYTNLEDNSPCLDLTDSGFSMKGSEIPFIYISPSQYNSDIGYIYFDIDDGIESIKFDFKVNDMNPAVDNTYTDFFFGILDKKPDDSKYPITGNLIILRTIGVSQNVLRFAHNPIDQDYRKNNESLFPNSGKHDTILENDGIQYSVVYHFNSSESMVYDHKIMINNDAIENANIYKFNRIINDQKRFVIGYRMLDSGSLNIQVIGLKVTP